MKLNSKIQSHILCYYFLCSLDNYEVFSCLFFFAVVTWFKLFFCHTILPENQFFFTTRVKRPFIQNVVTTVLTFCFSLFIQPQSLKWCFIVKRFIFPKIGTSLNIRCVLGWIVNKSILYQILPLASMNVWACLELEFICWNLAAVVAVVCFQRSGHETSALKRFHVFFFLFFPRVFACHIFHFPSAGAVLNSLEILMTETHSSI